MTDAPLDLDAIQARCPVGDCAWTQDGQPLHTHLYFDHTAHDVARTAADLLARVRQLEAERALYVGVEPTIAEEMAELSRRLDAVDTVAAQWADHCLGPQTRALLDEVRAAANGETRTPPAA